MFTSRAEFRLHLRIDNADTRLTPHGRALGLVENGAWAAFEAKQARAAALTQLLETAKLTEEESILLNTQVSYGQEFGLKGTGFSPSVKPTQEEGASAPEGTPPTQFTRGTHFAQLLKRPELTIEQVLPVLLPRMGIDPVFLPWLTAIQSRSASHLNPERWALGPKPLPAWVRNELKTVETSIKFAGYLAQQQRSIDRLRRDEARAIPVAFDYTVISGLSKEMQEKLTRVRPSTLGQASRLPGVTPAALSLIQCFLEIGNRHAEATHRRSA